MSVLLPRGLHLMRGQDVDIIALLQILRHPRYLPGMSGKETKKKNPRRTVRRTFRVEAAEQFSGEAVGTVGVGLNNAALRGCDVGERNAGSKYRRVTNILRARTHEDL